MNRAKNLHIRPIENLHQYVNDRSARQAAGWINGMWYLNGVYYTEAEFNEAFPAVLKYKVIQLDGKQVKTN